MQMPDVEGQEKGGLQAYLNRARGKSNLVTEWHRKLGHIHAERHFKLSGQDNEVPKFDRVLLNNHQCIPCLTAKARRSSLSPSTRKATRPLELIHLDISGKVEPSLHEFLYTAAFLDDFTAKSDSSS